MQKGKYRVGSEVVITSDPALTKRKIVEIAQKAGSDGSQQLLVSTPNKGRLVTTIKRVTIIKY